MISAAYVVITTILTALKIGPLKHVQQKYGLKNFSFLETWPKIGSVGRIFFQFDNGAKLR